MTEKFPKTIYVYRECKGDPDDEFFMVYESTDDAAALGDKRIIGVYELLETVTVEAVTKVTKLA